jgi:mannose-6-phosphate isomerase
MVIERARVRAVQKPWGAVDLRPWSEIRRDGVAVGELWYERDLDNAPDSSLLLKVLVTTQPLSIQVHPDDAFAQTMGLPRGKTEAWYILSAAPDAKVAVGLKRRIASWRLRQAVDDGSITDLVRWRRVVPDDVVFVPAGTIHAIGPGLVIAEIQQRSDTTFRMFDFGRGRELDVDNSVAVADAGPADWQLAESRFTEARTLLVINAHFVLERINLSPGSRWNFSAARETWLLVLNGDARVGTLDMSVGEAVFADGERVQIDVGSKGLKCLAAYPGPAPALGLLRNLDMPDGAPAIDRPTHPLPESATPPPDASTPPKLALAESASVTTTLPNRRTERHQ